MAALCLPSTSFSSLTTSSQPRQHPSTSTYIVSAFHVRIPLHGGFESVSRVANNRRSSVKVWAAAEDGEEKKNTPTLKKGEIVRVLKEKYIGSVEALAVDHPEYFTGLDYIYEDRGEVLDVRFFDGANEYVLIQWAGIPTAPAWLPATMLQKATKLAYLRS